MVNFPKLLYKKRMFQRNAQINNPDTVSFGVTSFCLNKTGIKSNISIGHHCDIHARICVSGKNGKINIGNNTTIRGHSLVGAIENITIGNNVIISNHVTIYDNNNHPTNPEVRIKMCESGFYSDLWSWDKSEHAPVVVGDNVWIGEYSTILKGVTIGKGAVVGCHSLVTKDVEPYSIVAGNPAKKVKSLMH